MGQVESGCGEEMEIEIAECLECGEESIRHLPLKIGNTVLAKELMLLILVDLWIKRDKW